MIAMSALLLLFLRLIANPLAMMGALIETWLNFLSYNPKLSVFIKNLVKGTLIPGRDSAAFISVIGHMDERISLDNRLKPRDGPDGYKYYSALCMMASKVSYENQAYIRNMVEHHWTMDYLGFYDCWNDYQEQDTTKVFLFRDRSDDDHDTIVVAFRGTEPFNAYDWSTDAKFSWREIYDMGKVHFGFTKALGLPKIDVDDDKCWPVECKENVISKRPLAYYCVRDELLKLLRKSEKTKFIVTGHSLGGALAILFAANLFHHENENDKLLLERLKGVYTFGQPRVGDKKFGESMIGKLKQHNILYFRFVYGYDMVPRLPYDDDELLFKHFSDALWYDKLYQGKVVQKLRNENYFMSLKERVLMKINATSELIRSFTIHYREGPDYKEGWLLVLTRIFGLLVSPGVSAHSAQDYVNCTRLGSSDVFLPPEEEKK